MSWKSSIQRSLRLAYVGVRYGFANCIISPLEITFWLRNNLNKKKSNACTRIREQSFYLSYTPKRRIYPFVQTANTPWLSRRNTSRSVDILVNSMMQWHIIMRKLNSTQIICQKMLNYIAPNASLNSLKCTQNLLAAGVSAPRSRSGSLQLSADTHGVCWLGTKKTGTKFVSLRIELVGCLAVSHTLLEIILLISICAIIQKF